MANSVDPDQTVCSGSTLFASILQFTRYVGQLFAADVSSRRHFQMHCFLALYGLILYLIKAHFDTFAKRADPDQAAFVRLFAARSGSTVCLWEYE